MHYTGTIWRPPYEASSLLLEVAAGCTHHKCKFCTLYDDIPFKFRMSPLEDVEADLMEAKKQFRLWKQYKIHRTFLTGANPFVLKFDRLMIIAALIKKYFPENQTIGCFSRITDISLKIDAELQELGEAGYDGLTIGIETVPRSAAPGSPGPTPPPGPAPAGGRYGGSPAGRSADRHGAYTPHPADDPPAA